MSTSTEVCTRARRRVRLREPLRRRVSSAARIWRGQLERRRRWRAARANAARRRQCSRLGLSAGTWARVRVRARAPRAGRRRWRWRSRWWHWKCGASGPGARGERVWHGQLGLWRLLLVRRAHHQLGPRYAIRRSAHWRLEFGYLVALSALLH